MKGVLLDTNVISASSPLRKGEGDLALRRWLVERSGQLHLPAVAVGEIRTGVEAARAKGHSRKAEALGRWLSQLVLLFAGRVLAVDLRVADLSGVLLQRARSAGHDVGWIDAQIAATAEANGLLLLTRNTRHFALLGVDFRDPFAEDVATLDALLEG